MFDLITLVGALGLLLLFLLEKKLIFLRLLNIWIPIMTLGVMYLSATLPELLIPDQYQQFQNILFPEKMSTFGGVLFMFELFLIPTFSLLYLSHARSEKMTKGILFLIILNVWAFLLTPLILSYSDSLADREPLISFLGFFVAPFTPYYGYGILTIPALVLANIIVVNIFITKLSKQKPKTKAKNKR